MAMTFITIKLPVFKQSYNQNTAESFNAIFERAKHGVHHYPIKKHLSRYLDEVGFCWNQRKPELKTTKTVKLKIVMKRLPALIMQ